MENCLSDCLYNTGIKKTHHHIRGRDWFHQGWNSLSHAHPKWWLRPFSGHYLCISYNIFSACRAAVHRALLILEACSPQACRYLDWSQLKAFLWVVVISSCSHGFPLRRTPNVETCKKRALLSWPGYDMRTWNLSPGAIGKTLPATLGYSYSMDRLNFYSNHSLQVCVCVSSVTSQCTHAYVSCSQDDRDFFICFIFFSSLSKRFKNYNDSGLGEVFSISASASSTFVLPTVSTITSATLSKF